MIVVALIVSAMVATLGALLLKLSLQEVKFSSRGQANEAAFLLAEAGLDQALHALNNNWVNATYGWSTATDGTAMIRSTFSGIPIDPGTGSIRIRIDNAGGGSPIVTALGAVILNNQSAAIRQLRIKVIPRTYASAGLVARGAIVFDANTFADSYDSSLGPYNAISNRADKIFVGTLSNASGALTILSNSYIYGFAATGGSAPTVTSTHAPNVIYGSTTTTGARVDPARLRTDFTATLPTPIVPAGSPIVIGGMTGSATLPRGGDLPGANGRYLYQTNSLSLNAKGITIAAHVDLIVTGDFTMRNNSGIVLGLTGSSFRLYAGGNVTIDSGTLINNLGDPSKCSVVGTASPGSTFAYEFASNTRLYATINAPNADLVFNSNAFLAGSVVANSIHLNSNVEFHYDSNLVNSASADYVQIVNWVELHRPSSSGSGQARDNRQPFGSLVN